MVKFCANQQWCNSIVFNLCYSFFTIKQSVVMLTNIFGDDAIVLFLIYATACLQLSSQLRSLQIYLETNISVHLHVHKKSEPLLLLPGPALCLSLSFCLPVCPFLSLSLSLCLSLSLSVSVCLSVSLFSSLSISTFLLPHCISLSVPLSVCLSLCDAVNDSLSLQFEYIKDILASDNNNTKITKDMHLAIAF